MVDKSRDRSEWQASLFFHPTKPLEFFCVDIFGFIKLNNPMTLTQVDLNEIETLVKTTVKEEISNLPTKDEFYGKMDEVMGEIKAVREEQAATAGILSSHEDRITKLEEKTGIASV